MMIPPLVRVGPPPAFQPGVQQPDMVVLTERGWHIVKWDWQTGLLMDIDPRIPHTWRLMHPTKVLCWMPEDGS